MRKNMNIKLIKAEIEKLSLMLSAWEQSEQVSAIERDIVLDKLKKIYDAVRFDTAIEEDTPIEPTEPVAPVPAVEENDEESDEKEVEVELIFADDEFPEEDLVDEEEIEEVEQPSVTDIIAATVANALAGASVAEAVEETAPEKPSVPEMIVVEPAKEEETIVVEPAPIEVELPHEEIPVVAPEPEPEPEPEPVPEEKPIEKPAEKPIETPIEEKPAEKPAKKAAREMNSLFNMDEVRRQPRSKHQRMMSIYNSEPKQEKVVDISKIFNLDIDEPAEATPAEVAPVETKPVAKPIAEPVAKPIAEPVAKPIAEPVAKPKPVEVPVAKPIVEEKPQTLADAIPATQTLADVITAPTALAEEINNARVHSLRDGIGLNDKFLMIRDLFDGDGEAYDEAINALDAMETFDDCMIHIIENYAWNPDSEGSKFIMQLLERKLS